MKISWLGHASFLLETKAGVKIITDPYESGSYDGALGYEPINLKPDIVTISHQHPDHNYIQDLGQPAIVDKDGKTVIKDIEIEGILSYHDKAEGKDRGQVIIFIITLDGLRIAHFSDLGTLDVDYTKLQGLDIALVPVGGVFTIDAKEATELIDKINPRMTIPMHFKTPKLGFDILGVEEFLEVKDYQTENILEVTSESLNSFKPIVVLNYQR